MPFDILSGFQVGQQLAGRNAVGIMAENVLSRVNALQNVQLQARGAGLTEEEQMKGAARFSQSPQAQQQALAQHTLRMTYDPEYRFKYQLYSQLNDTMGQQGTGIQPPSLGIAPTTGYATGGRFAPGTQVSYAQSPLSTTPGQPQQFLQPTSGQPSGLLDRGTLQRAALAGVFPLLGKRFEAQETEAGRLAGQYANPQEAARLRAGVEAEQARTGVAQRQLQYPGLFKRVEMSVLPPVGAPQHTTVTIPGVGEVSVTREQ